MKNNIKRIGIALCPLTFFVYMNVLADDSIEMVEKCESISPYELSVSKDSRLLYIRVDSLCIGFTKRISDSLRTLFKENSPEKIEGTVLDFRNTKPEATWASISGLASIFIAPNTLLATDKSSSGKYYPIKTGKSYYQNTQEPDYLHNLPSFLLNSPLAVLVSRETKDAPEFLANTFLRNRNALLLGEEFENGIDDQIKLQNPFYQLVAPMISVKERNRSETKTEKKLYLTFESEHLGPFNCSKEEQAEIAMDVSQSINKSVKYPRSAQTRGNEGVGKIVVILDKKGNLLNQYIEKSTGHDDLDMAMLEAAQQTQFPYSDCLGEKFAFAVPIRFNLY